jgi:hypothetical protein
VPYRSHVHMRLRTLEFGFGHGASFPYRCVCAGLD